MGGTDPTTRPSHAAFQGVREQEAGLGAEHSDTGSVCLMQHLHHLGNAFLLPGLLTWTDI